MLYRVKIQRVEKRMGSFLVVASSPESAKNKAEEYMKDDFIRFPIEDECLDVLDLESEPQKAH